MGPYCGSTSELAGFVDVCQIGKVLFFASAIMFIKHPLVASMEMVGL